MIRDKHFMLDIETTGVSLDTDDVLEIGVVEMLPTDDGWAAGREFHQVVHSTRQPTSEFAKKHMPAVYAASNKASPLAFSVIRGLLTIFFAECGKTGHDVLICGWNAANFDVPFLQKKGFLVPPGYLTVDGKDTQVGDHHYRVYEMCGAFQLMADVKRLSYEQVKEAAAKAFPSSLPAGKDHDAIYDCHKQIKLLNGLIAMGRIL